MMRNDVWIDYPRIAHYTNFETVFKILDSKVLWSTHFSYLNDTSEFYYSLKLISQAVYDGLKIFPNCPSLETVKIMLKESLYKGLNNGLFLTSFCKIDLVDQDDGLLSMWRSYGSDGCYMEFNTKEIHDYLARKSVSGVFDTVIYGEPIERKQELKEKTDKIVELVIRFAQKQELKGLLTPFANLATMLKHPGFHEEKEIRLAIINSVSGHMDETFQVQSFLGKEHIEWPFEPTAVKKIVVGLHLNQQVRIEQISRWLRTFNKYQHVEVVGSTIPYREKYIVPIEESEMA